MQKFLPILASLALIGPAAAQLSEPNSSQEEEAPKVFEIGKPIDVSIELKDIRGKTHKLGDYRGKVVFINFWSKNCPYLKVADPKLNQIRKDYPADKVVVLGIDANQAELVSEDPDEPYATLVAHVEEKELEFPILVDHGNVIADRFAAKTTPHCFVIDQEGVLRYSGALDDDPRDRKGDEAVPYVRNAIDAVLAGKDVATSSTKPYG